MIRTTWFVVCIIACIALFGCPHGENTISGGNRDSIDVAGQLDLKEISELKPVSDYSGGRAVIFRLDDVTVGWHEDAVQALIEIFIACGVPLDCGVISNASGSSSYELPWLKYYLEEGLVGISLHGFDWTPNQLDTMKSGLSYEYIKYQLKRARELFLDYYDTSPVAITVPTDFYDKSGYLAASDAGYKIFSTQLVVEPHPSIVPVDYEGIKDPNGMYRLPTASDLCQWKDNRFTDPFDVSNLIKTGNYCDCYKTILRNTVSNDFGYLVCSELSELNVAVISLHASAFVDQGGFNYDKAKKVTEAIKWIKSFATITTFERWYNDITGNK